MSPKLIQSVKKWAISIAIAFFLSILLRLFVLESYTYFGNSMANSIFWGESVFINKFGAVKRNKIVALYFPSNSDKKDIDIKRCVALPGDTLQIINKQLFVNHTKEAENQNLGFNYRFLTYNPQKWNYFADKYHLTAQYALPQLGIYESTISQTVAGEIIKDSVNKNFTSVTIPKNHTTNEILLDNRKLRWNKDYFGSLVVPRKGMNIALSKSKIAIYRKVIENEQKGATFENNKLFINTKEVTNYTFLHNYYFVLNDNRDNSDDSRKYGFVKESNIIGSAVFIWFSIDNKHKIRWNRLFSSIH